MPWVDQELHQCRCFKGTQEEGTIVGFEAGPSRRLVIVWDNKEAGLPDTVLPSQVERIEEKENGRWWHAAVFPLR